MMLTTSILMPAFLAALRMLTPSPVSPLVSTGRVMENWRFGLDALRSFIACIWRAAAAVSAMAAPSMSKSSWVTP